MSGYLSPALASELGAESLNSDGVKALNEHNFPLAIRNFDAAVSADPTFQPAKDNLVSALKQYGLENKYVPDISLKAFHKTLYISPKDVTTQAHLMDVYKFMKKNPKFFVDRLALGEKAREDGDLPGAVIEYAEAIKIHEDPYARERLGEVYRSLGENDNAIDQFRAAIVAGGDEAEYQLRLAQAYAAKKDFEKAVSYYEKAKISKAADPEVQEGLVYSWKQIVEKNPSSARNHIGLGLALQNQGKIDQASAEFKQAQSLSPGSAIKGIATHLHSSTSNTLSTLPLQGVSPELISIKAALDKEISAASERWVYFGPYLADLNRRINRKWFPPKDVPITDPVVLTFKIDKTGKLANLRLLETSDAPKQDAAGMKAVGDAAPFGQLPSGSVKSDADSVEFIVKFSPDLHKSYVGLDWTNVNQEVVLDKLKPKSSAPTQQAQLPN